jgi:hypothetical protein
MPKPPIKRNAVLLDPPEVVSYRLQNGVTLVKFSIFRDEETGNELIQCDLCGFFVSLTATRHTSYMTGHRGKDQCRKAAIRQVTAAIHMEAMSAHRDGFQPPDAQIGALLISYQDCLMRQAAEPINSTASGSTNVSRSQTPRPLTPLALALDRQSSLPPSSPPSVISPAKSILSEHETLLSDHLNDEEGKIVHHTVKVEDGFCTGQWLRWEAGSVFGTYPYQQHTNEGLPWLPIGFKEDWILLRALACTELLESTRELERSTCDACHELLNSQHLSRVVGRATEGAAPRTPWHYLSAVQLQQLLVISREKNRVLTLSVSLSSFVYS